MASCNGCDTTWTGTAQAHCAKCHNGVFSTASNFDAHLAFSGTGDTLKISCLDPARVGLVKNDRGIWRRPDERDISDWKDGNKDA